MDELNDEILNDDNQIHNFNDIRTGHLHLSDWALIVTALERLVIELEESGGQMFGNMVDRAHGLRHNIKHVILESDEPN
ncbi:MAG: hypothetical protein VW982_08235 [Candidatus Poseidoniales archaeon]|jgi:hypothetical protein